VKPAATTQKRNEWATTDNAPLLNDSGSLRGIRDQVPHHSIHAGRIPQAGWLRWSIVSLNRFDIVERLEEPPPVFCRFKAGASAGRLLHLATIPVPEFLPRETR